MAGNDLDKHRCSSTEPTGSSAPSVDRLIEMLEAAHDNAASADAIRYHKSDFNAAIATAIWGPPKPSGDVAGPQTLVWWDGGLGRCVAPDFVGSLDAALTLVPEGFAVRDLTIWPGAPSTVTVWGTRLGHDGKHWHDYLDGRWSAETATAPLALCIAALKARAASLPTGRVELGERSNTEMSFDKSNSSEGSRTTEEET